MHDMLTDRFGDELEIVAVQPKRQFFRFPVRQVKLLAGRAQTIWLLI